MKNKKLISLIVFAVILTLLVTACGGGQSQPKSQPKEEENTPQESQGPKVGGDLVVGIAGDPYSIAP